MSLRPAQPLGRPSRKSDAVVRCRMPAFVRTSMYLGFLILIALSSRASMAASSCWSDATAPLKDYVIVDSMIFHSNSLLVSGTNNIAGQYSKGILFRLDLATNLWQQCFIPFSLSGIQQVKGGNTLYALGRVAATAAARIIAVSDDDGDSWKPVRPPMAEFLDVTTMSVQRISDFMLATVFGSDLCCNQGGGGPVRAAFSQKQNFLTAPYVSKASPKSNLSVDNWSPLPIDAMYFGRSHQDDQVAYSRSLNPPSAKVWLSDPHDVSQWTLVGQWNTPVYDALLFPNQRILTREMDPKTKQNYVRITQNGQSKIIPTQGGYRFELVDDQTAYLYGGPGSNSVSRTDDQGDTWKDLALPISGTVGVVAAQDKNNAVVSIYTNYPAISMFATTDGGATWTNLMVPWLP